MSYKHKLNDPEKDYESIKNHYLCMIELIFRENGIVGLSYKWLKDNSHIRLYNIVVGKYKYKMEILSNKFGVIEEWKKNRKDSRYKTKDIINWNCNVFEEICNEIITKYGYIPPAQFLRDNNYGAFVSYMYKNNYTYEQLNKKFNINSNPKHMCRNGMNFRSLAEACLANYLYSRSIPIKQGERYSDTYSQLTGRKYGMYDLHFIATNGIYADKWINCEVWGYKPMGHSEEAYAVKRKQKEEFHKDDKLFLGINYFDCYKEDRLNEILDKYIGNITPKIYTCENDYKFKPTEWSLASEVIEQCKYIIENNCGILPSEDWLRKRGKHKNRETHKWESKYNLGTLSVNINKIGGIRKIRDIIKSTNTSTNIWNATQIIDYFTEIYKIHNKTPQSLLSKLRRQETKTAEEHTMQNKLCSAISSCTIYFKDKYREACLKANIPIRKIPNCF